MHTAECYKLIAELNVESSTEISEYYYASAEHSLTSTDMKRWEGMGKLRLNIRNGEALLPPLWISCSVPEVECPGIGLM